MLMILFCFPLFSLYVSVGPIVYHVTQSSELSLGSGRYTTIFCFGFPGYAYYKMSVYYLQSQNIVWIPLVYLLIASLTNGILQYVFIIQLNLGIAGASSAYVISMYVSSVLIFGHIRLFRKDTPQIGLTIDLISKWCHTIQYVVPSIIQISVGAITTNMFPVILLILINHDKNELAIYSILYSVWMVFALFTNGYYSALTVRVGHHLGASDTTRAKRSAVFGIIFAGNVLLCTCIVAFLSSSPLSNIFTTDKNFVEELQSNFKFLPVLILSDVFLLGQGVMNACGMQHTVVAIKFALMFVLGFILECYLMNYVSWKALLMFTVQSLVRNFCFVIFMFLLLLRNWNTFTQKANKNTQITDIQERRDISHSLNKGILDNLKKISDSEIFKYLIPKYSLIFIESYNGYLNVYLRYFEVSLNVIVILFTSSVFCC